MGFQVHMTVTGNNVVALLIGQLDGKPIQYLFAPDERKRITFDAIEMPVWGKGKYGVTYRTLYFESEAENAKCFGGFDQTYILPDDMIAEALATNMSGQGYLYQS